MRGKIIMHKRNISSNINVDFFFYKFREIESDKGSNKIFKKSVFVCDQLNV